MSNEEPKKPTPKMCTWHTCQNFVKEGDKLCKGHIASLVAIATGEQHGARRC